MSLVPISISRLWWRRYLARNARPADDLELFPALRPGQQRRDLATRLLAQIHEFGHREDALPEWREAARIQDPDDLWRLWPSLPILTKEALRNRFPPENILRRGRVAGTINSTGGSTGEPLRFVHDLLMRRSVAAAAAFTGSRMGWSPGIPTIILWGSERDIRKQTRPRDRIHGRLRNEFLVDGYHLSDVTVARVLSLARRHRPAVLRGFTSMLAFVAERALETRRQAPGLLQAAINGGEMLYPEQNDRFRAAFGIPILNRYGGRELGAMAYQTSEGDPLTILRPWLFAEIVDEHGRPVGPGETGRLLWTSTVCRGTPFLRYEIGDLASFEAPHEDESGVRMLAELRGRTAGLLHLPDGRPISNLYWNHLLKGYAEIRQFQVILGRDGALRLLLRGEGLQPARQTCLESTLRYFLGSVPFHLEWVEQIPLTAQGKFVQVVRE
jgi:phenylacetate-CoA ligase